MKEYYLRVTDTCWLPKTKIRILAEVERPTPGEILYFIETDMSRLKLKRLGGVLKIRTTLNAKA